MRDIVTVINDGHKNITKRHPDPYVDRKERAIIEHENHNGDCIINVGDGYYRPVPGEPVDDKEYNEYIAKERSRARKILSKVLSMQLAHARKKFEIECGVEHDGT